MLQGKYNLGPACKLRMLLTPLKDVKTKTCVCEAHVRDPLWPEAPKIFTI